MTAEPALVEWIPSRVGGRSGHRLMVILVAPGCAYAKRTGGCTNCSFPQSLGSGSPVSSEEYCAQLEAAIARIPPDDEGPVQVDLFVSGSFFNPGEVQIEAQRLLLERAARIPRIERILVETRPEYVDAASLERVKAAIGGVLLEVAIGLESADEEIRERRIRKGFSFRQFEEAAGLVAEAGAALRVYLLLKPMDTKEAEAIEDLVESAKRVFALGRKFGLEVHVALEPCFVAPGTPLFDAYAAGRYRPPWLWSVIEVVGLIADLGEVQVGLSEEGLNPARSAHNCEKCSATVRRALAVFNSSQDPAPLTTLDCACREEWIQNLPG